MLMRYLSSTVSQYPGIDRIESYFGITFRTSLTSHFGRMTNVFGEEKNLKFAI